MDHLQVVSGAEMNRHEYDCANCNKYSTQHHCEQRKFCMLARARVGPEIRTVLTFPIVVESENTQTQITKILE
jgi:hypothetical protein